MKSVFVRMEFMGEREGRFDKDAEVRVNRKGTRHVGQTGRVNRKMNPPGDMQSYEVELENETAYFWDNQLDPTKEPRFA